MSAQNYRGVSPPVGKGPAVYDVCGATLAVPLDLTFLDEMFLGLVAHWTVNERTKQGRSRLCHHFEGDCPYCLSGDRVIWLGFAAVFNNAESRREVFRCGPEGARQIVKHSAQYGGLRGVRLEIRSAKAGRTSGLEIRPSDKRPMLPMMQAHSVDATVCLVLGCVRIPADRYSAAELSGPSDSDENGGV